MASICGFFPLKLILIAIDDSSEVEMESDDKKIISSKKIHPLELEDDLFEGIDPFIDKEIEEVKKSLFSNIKSDN